MPKPKILIISDFFLPGFKSGGGMRTVVNTVQRLQDAFEFYVITRDHDGFSDRFPYPNIEYGKWNIVAGAKVHYLASSEITPWRIAELVRSCRPDAVYLNSVFSTLSVFFFIYRLFGLFNGIPVGLAACGELFPSALAKGHLKKRVFVFVARMLRLYRGVTWRASDENEKTAIEALRFSPVLIAPDLTVSIHRRVAWSSQKMRGSLRLLYFSRIDPIKNLEFLLSLLPTVRGALSLTIVGPNEDRGYLRRLQGVAADLPDRISVEFVGPKTHLELGEMIPDFDFFVLPTLGENFGHVIAEALSASLPVLISDRTPWRGLANRQAGFDLALEDRAVWTRTLNRLVDMEEEELEIFRNGAAKEAGRVLGDGEALVASRKFFEVLLDSTLGESSN